MSLQLTGPQAMKLQMALLSAFSFDELRMLVKFELNEDLDVLVGRGALQEVVYDLIQWSNRQGRAEDLIRAALRARPWNPQIQEVAKDLLPPETPPAAQPKKATFDGSFRARMRGIIKDQFPSEIQVAMLLDASLSVALTDVATGGNLPEILFKLIEWMKIDVDSRVKPFLAQAVMERPNSTELKMLYRDLFGELK
jgi:hypothetical protein